MTKEDIYKKGINQNFYEPNRYIVHKAIVDRIDRVSNNYRWSFQYLSHSPPSKNIISLYLYYRNLQKYSLISPSCLWTIVIIYFIST